MQRSYIAFISYRHQPLDTDVAKKLHRMIERYRMPKNLCKEKQGGRLGYVFRDRDELSASGDLSASIKEALDHSEYLIVVCTSDTPKSIWVEREIEYFLEHHDRSRILAVLADGCPQDSFPDLLIHSYYNGELVNELEPLAANIVAGTKNKALRKLKFEGLKIIAALVGCSFDELYQRERRFRKIQLTAFIMAVFLIATGFIGLLLVKNTQITMKNQELIKQKRDIQLKESQLLTSDAREALENRDYVLAIQHAIEALPKNADDNRQHYAPAEQVLISSLGIFDKSTDLPRTFIAETELKMDTPIRHVCASADGGTIVLSDDYGNLTAFDVKSGDKLWHNSMFLFAKSGQSDSNIYSKMFIDNANNAVLYAFGDIISSYSLTNGLLLWHHELENVIEPLVHISDDGSLLAFVERNDVTLIEDGSLIQNYDLVILRTKDGVENNRICIAEERLHSQFQLGNTMVMDNVNMQNGLFYNEGKMFVGFYYENIYGRVSYYIADLEKGTSRVIFSEDIEIANVLHVDINDRGDELIVLQTSEEYNVAVKCKAISITDGRVLWEVLTPKVEGEYFDYDSDFRFLTSGDRLLFSRQNHLYQLNTKTGKIEDSVTLFDNVKCLMWVDDGVFAFVLANGYYALGWRSGSGFVDSSLSGYCFNVENNSQAIFINRGFLFPEIQNNSVLDFKIKNNVNAEGFGCVACVSEDEKRTLRIKYILPSVDSNTRTVAGFDFDKYSISPYSGEERMYLCNEYAYIFGHTYEDGTIEEIVAVLDTETQNVVQEYAFSRDYNDKVYPFSDGSGLLFLDDRTCKRLDFATNQIDILVEEKTEDLYTQKIADGDDTITYVDSVAKVSATYRENAGCLLAAACDGSDLRWWLDGIEQETIALPDDVIWQVNQKTSYARVLMAASNGCIYMSDFGNSVTGTLERIIAYDTIHKKWNEVVFEGLGDAECIFVPGKQQPLIASLDYDGSLSIYDIEVGRLLRKIMVYLPYDYIKEIKFILDDQYILMRVEGGQLIILDAQNGDQVYLGELDEGYGETIVDVDSLGERVIILDTYYNKAIILDRESWIELARLDEVYSFNSKTNELYFYSYLEGLFCKVLPTRSELIEMGQRMIEGITYKADA